MELTQPTWQMMLANIREYIIVLFFVSKDNRIFTNPR